MGAMNIFSSKARGFTLIELLVVVAIIGILASVITANVATSKSKSRDGKRVADLKILQLALELYYNDNQKFPLTLGTLITGGYLPLEPKDPSNNTTSYYYSAITLTSYGSTNCGAVATAIKYHLGAAMENDELSNTALKQDHDWPGAANSGGVYALCGASGADFHGNSNTGGTQPCVGTSQANPNIDKCYDVTN